MRKIGLLLGPVVATAALFACEDSGSSGSPGVFTLDTGTFEASPQPEAGPTPDGAVDAPGFPPGVTLNVVRGAGPAADVTVVFHDAAGVVTEVKITGADGKATSSPGVSPVQASILLGAGSRRHIITWTAVEPGDQIFARDVGESVNAGTYDVTTQGTFADGGAAGLNASIGNCVGYNNQSPVTVFMSAECERPTVAILARAFAPGLNDIRAYAFAKGKPPGPNDAGAGSAAVGPWLTPAAAMITPKNLPVQLADIAALYEIADNLGIDNPTGIPNPTTGTTTFKVAPGFADAYQAAVRVTPNLTPGARLMVAKRSAPAANTDIDFAGMPPTIDGAALVTTTLARPQVDWTTVGGAPLTSTDGGSVVISWSDQRENSGTWTLIVPTTSKTVKAPAMPASAGPWLPHGANDAGPAVNFGDPTVVFVEADILASYAAFRSQVGLVMPLSESFLPDARAILPANGTIKLTSFTRPPPS